MFYDEKKLQKDFRMKILIVEDETDLQHILGDFLSREKYSYAASHVNGVRVGIGCTISAGNLLKMGARFGRATGNFGTVLLGNGHGNFIAMSPRESGLCIRGEVRNIVQDKERVIFALNDKVPLVYGLRRRGEE